MNCKNAIPGLLAAAAVMTAGSAFGAPILTVPTDVFTTTTGTVTVGLGDSTPGQLVYGYNLEFVITPEAGAVGSVTFAAANAATEASSPLFNDTPAFNRINATTLYVSDFSFSGVAPATAPLSTHLVNLSYTTAANTLGNFAVTVFESTGSAYDAQILDGNGQPIAGSTFVNGSITVAAVPEPASIGLLAAVTGLMFRRRNR